MNVRRSRKMVRLMAVVCGCSALVCWSSTPLLAVTKTWSAGASGNWDTATSNWNSGTATFDNMNDTARFTNSASVTLTENIEATGILIDAGNLTVTVNNTTNETLTLNGTETNDIRSNNQAMNLTINPNLTLSGAHSWNSGGPNSSVTVNGDISGSSNVTASLGKLRLMGNNSGWLGNLSVNANLELGQNSAFGTGNVSFTSNSFSIEAIGGDRVFTNTLGMNQNNSNRTISFIGANAIEFTGNFPISVFTPSSGTPTRTFETLSTADTTFSGVISRTSSNVWNFEKTGFGRLILSGNNTYDGPTLVNGGTLLINGTTSNQGAYTVAAGATLGGTGSIGLSGVNAVTLLSDSHLAPGASVGTLNVNGNMVLSEGSIYDWEYGPTLTDLTTVAGTLTLPSVLQVNLLELPGGVLPTSSILFSASAFSGASDLSGWIFNGPDEVQFTAVIDGNDVVLNAFTPIPEPSSASLLLLGGLGLLWRKRQCGRRAEN